LPLIKFSKPSTAVIKNKKSFFDENEKHLAYVRGVNNLYTSQPPRKFCKTCGSPLNAATINIQDVQYAICGTCGHFNGLHQDTHDFAKVVYTAGHGENYSKNYKSDYMARVVDIYKPKVEFLGEALAEDGVTNFAISDVGCGGGHFVAACEQLQIRCVGYDTNAELIRLGSEMLSENSVQVSELEDITDVIRSVNTPVLSLIGVLEHLMNPLEALMAFKESDAKYLYLQVPLFSFSVLLESANKDIFPRQLNAGHTHLYTRQSLEYLKNRFQFKTVGEWWFGTDMVDLFRHLSIKASVDEESRNELIWKLLGSHIDDLQSVLDRTKNCSGVNLIWSK
jgi:hypothetical protein